jgi:peroxiredoxin
MEVMMRIGKMMLKMAMVCGLVLSFSTYSSTAFAGNNAPTFTLRDINKKEVSLEDYKGKVVLVNFWATWCGPCQAEMPHLQKMYVELEDQGFVVLSISADNARDASKVKPLVKRNRYTFPVLLDTDSTVLNQYNPESVLPYNVLIGKDGNIIWQKASYAPGEEVELRAKVVEALGGSENTEQETETETATDKK